MRLPRLSPDEIRALQTHGTDPDGGLVERIKAHLAAVLPARIRVGASVLTSCAELPDAESPQLRADDDLLAAWVAARFGSGSASRPVPAHYGTSLYARLGLAMAEQILRGQLEAATALHLEIHLDDAHGRLALDWRDMSAEALRKWAVEQWESKHG